VYAHAAGVAGNLSQANLVIGLRYTMVWRVAGRTAGTITPQFGTAAGIARDAVGIYTSDMTCAGNTSLAFVADAAFDGTVELLSITCTSVTQWTDRANPAHGLVQATASLVPWRDQATGMLRFARGEDRMASTRDVADWGFLHRPDCTHICAYVPIVNAAGAEVLWGTGIINASTSNRAGVLLNTNGRVGVRVQAGGVDVANAVSANNIHAAGQPMILVYRFRASGADAVELWAHGQRVIGVNPDVEPSAGDPPEAYTCNSRRPGTGDGPSASHASHVAFTRALGDGELHRVCLRLAADLRALTGLAFTW
jgi:hypothetical protein